MSLVRLPRCKDGVECRRDDGADRQEPLSRLFKRHVYLEIAPALRRDFF
jgi:hypothetical protein